MKRTLGGSDNSLIPICSSAGEDQEDVYDREFHPIMEGRDEEDGGDYELCGVAALPGGGAKKRRLSTEQVRALEKNFEVENKLEPERKVRLAKELGLQPRQVAVWFQNRRARWKTKQLEREYAALKTSYDALRLDFDFLHRDKESLLSQVKDVKAKLAGNDSMSFSSVVKQEPVASETAAKAGEPEEPPAAICKDETSDSDNSSAVVNDAVAVQDENSPQLTTPSDTLSAATLGVAGEFGGCSSMLLGSDSRMRFFYDQHHEILKVEEEEFLSKPCSSFFADEPAPALGWYYSDHWS